MPAKLSDVLWLKDLSKAERYRLREFTRPNGYARGWLATPRKDDLCVVATSRGKQVGLGVLRVFRDDCLNHGMYSIFVKPTMRRKGVGTALLRALRDDAAQRFPGITLTAMPPDAGAAAFFEKVL